LPGWNDGYFQVGNLRLHYIDYGGSGEPLVAVHGLIQNGHSFDGIAPVLTPHVRLLALDLRGRGDSDWAPADCYKVRHFMIDVSSFVRFLGLTRFAMIGTSMGGMLALLYAMAHPDQVTRLVLNDISLNTSWPGIVHTLRRIAAVPTEFANLEEATAWFLKRRERSGRIHTRTVEQWVNHFLVRTPTGKLLVKCDPAIIQQALLSTHEPGPEGDWSRRQELWSQVHRLTMPVLLLRAGLGDVVLPESAEQTIQALPQARCVEVPEVGHSPTLYEPEAHAALCEFFGVPLPGAGRRSGQAPEDPQP
jgi:pimeloyl-ACP methyl ester carboxylesterase